LSDKYTHTKEANRKGKNSSSKGMGWGKEKDRRQGGQDGHWPRNAGTRHTGAQSHPPPPLHGGSGSLCGGFDRGGSGAAPFGAPSVQCQTPASEPIPGGGWDHAPGAGCHGHHIPTTSPPVPPTIRLCNGRTAASPRCEVRRAGRGGAIRPPGVTEPAAHGCCGIGEGGEDEGHTPAPQELQTWPPHQRVGGDPPAESQSSTKTGRTDKGNPARPREPPSYRSSTGYGNARGLRAPASREHPRAESTREPRAPAGR
jgi:hypothetical protein